MSNKRKHSPDTTTTTTTASPSLFRSSPIHDRSSIFIGYFSPTLPPRQLQKSPEFAEASHKVLAWRREGDQKLLIKKQDRHVLYDVGHDDDGEKYAGKKVEAVLERLGAIGSCVVARWYGGVMLGPVRFAHIEAVAEEAVRVWEEERGKKRRLEEEGKIRERLVEVLGERDRSIVVLRQLAGEKEEAVKKGIVEGVRRLEGSQGGEACDGEVEAVKAEQATTTAQPVKAAMDYATMSLERLRALEKGRDATLAFLLKRIDKAEANLAALKDPEEQANET